MWETRLVDLITVWPATTDGFGGQTFGAPEPVLGRWRDHAEKFIQSDGQEVVSKAIVFLNRKVNVGDWLAQGEYTMGDPVALGAIEVRATQESRDLRRLITVYKAVL